MDTPLVINIDTGVISFQNEENDSQVNCRRISYKHARMVEDGDISVKDLIAAIKKHIAANEEFDFDKYTDERRKLNVRKTALVPNIPERKIKDRSDEEVSDMEIEAVKNEVKEDDVGAAVEKLAAAADNAEPEAVEPPKAERRARKQQSVQATFPTPSFSMGE